MKALHLIALASLTLSTLASAEQTINYPTTDPIFSISFPDAWKVEAEGQSVSASSADELVNMELIALEAEELSGAITDAKEALDAELKGIKWDEAQEGDMNGLKVSLLNGEVVLEGVKMAVNCAVFEPKGADTYFMLFNTVPMESLEKHGEEVGKVFASIKGSKK